MSDVWSRAFCESQKVPNFAVKGKTDIDRQNIHKSYLQELHQVMRLEILQTIWGQLPLSQPIMTPIVNSLGLLHLMPLERYATTSDERSKEKSKPNQCLFLHQYHQKQGMELKKFPTLELLQIYQDQLVL